MTATQLSPLFFGELAAIVLAARAAGWLCRRYLGQPQVVGEMLAGILLGPSLLGAAAPGIEAALFPKEARGLLYLLSQFGVALYMFIVGLGFRVDHFKANARSAAAVSVSGMATPFALAFVLSPWLVRVPGLFGPRVTPVQATLFVGASIAITAFPMLARIIRERGLSDSPFGLPRPGGRSNRRRRRLGRFGSGAGEPRRRSYGGAEGRWRWLGLRHDRLSARP